MPKKICKNTGKYFMYIFFFFAIKTIEFNLKIYAKFYNTPELNSIVKIFNAVRILPNLKIHIKIFGIEKTGFHISV